MSRLLSFVFGDRVHEGGIAVGFFSRLFGGEQEDSVESRLQREYTAIFQSMGMVESQAANTARDMLAQAQQEVTQRGWATEGPNRGDWLLQQEAIDPSVRAHLETLRREGVQNEDIRWWWNLHPLERAMLEKIDEMNRTAAYVALRRQGLNAEQAGGRLWRMHPAFGDPAKGQGDDRPLPIELKRRINQFIERHYATPDIMRKKTDQATSFNALVREEMRRGSL